MLRRLGVRGKILATLAVPVFVLTAAAGWLSYDSLQEDRRARQTSELVDSLKLQDGAGTAAAQERALNIAAMLGVPGMEQQLEAAYEQTDRALDARDAALRSLPTDALDSRVHAAISETLVADWTLEQLRREIRGGRVSETEATAQYTAIIEDALAVPLELANTTTDRELALRIEA